jgi:hypothetical protein
MAVNCVGVRAMPGAVPYKALKVSHPCPRLLSGCSDPSRKIPTFFILLEVGM